MSDLLKEIEDFAKTHSFTCSPTGRLLRIFTGKSVGSCAEITNRFFYELTTEFTDVTFEQPVTDSSFVEDGGSMCIIDFTLPTPKRQPGVYLVVCQHQPGVSYYDGRQWNTLGRGVTCRKDEFEWVAKQPLDLEGLVPAPYEYRKTGWYKCVTTSDEKVINYWCADKKCWSFTPRLIDSKNWDDGTYESINEHAVGWG